MPIISKILEKAVHGQIYRYLHEHKLLTSKLFGFREKLSTTVALTHFTDTILKNMDDSKITGVVFVDLSKGVKRSISWIIIYFWEN